MIDGMIVHRIQNVDGGGNRAGAHLCPEDFTQNITFREKSSLLYTTPILYYNIYYIESTLNFIIL